MKYWMLIFTFISVQAFAAEQMSYDCRKWKNNPEPEDKSQYFVKDDDSVGFFNESEHFFISEANKAPILFMKDKDVFISVNGQDGFSFAAVSNTDLKMGTRGLMAGISELSKGAWMISKGGQRVFRIEVLEPTSKFMALSCEQGESCVAVDRAAKKKYSMEKDPDVVDVAKKQFQADTLSAALNRTCELLQSKTIDRDIFKFENACKRKSKLKLPDRLRRQEICEEAKLTLQPLFAPAAP